MVRWLLPRPSKALGANTSLLARLRPSAARQAMAGPHATPAVTVELRPSTGAGYFTFQETWSCNLNPCGVLLTVTAGHIRSEIAAGKAWGVGVARLFHPPFNA